MFLKNPHKKVVVERTNNSPGDALSPREMLVGHVALLLLFVIAVLLS
ncbi:hypothetical protein [Mariniblastus fucicola]|uniref:Uncharacterized protein n=1 Tax=Mariniblastus fucicola TaxID=980251 RepID=A0A5B9PI22_9BACT|nr:hypothetical protein [Mariniblastus fucicola]QEG24925.1 hypothetical protein MFFC18_48480 [Mariniblastus fucicola]